MIEIIFMIVVFILLLFIATNTPLKRKFKFKLTEYNNARFTAAMLGVLAEFVAIYNTYRFIDDLDETTAIEYTMQDLKLENKEEVK